MATANDPVVPKPASVPQRTSAEEREDRNMEHMMRDYFASRPKVSVKTREDEWVQIKGYTFIIKAGERVDVPVDVFDILEESGRI